MIRFNPDSYMKKLMFDYAVPLVGLFKRKSDHNVLEYLLSILSEKEFLGLHRRLKRECTSPKFTKFMSEEKLRYLKSLLEDLDDYVPSDPDDYTHVFLRRIYPEFNKSYSLLIGLLEEFIKRKRLACEKQSERKKSVLKTRLEQIRAAFGLKPKEADILTFFYLCSTFDQVKSAFYDSSLKMGNVRQSVAAYRRIFNVTAEELRTILKKDGILFRSGLIERDYNGTIDVPAHVCDYLSGLSDEDLNRAYFEFDSSIPEIGIKDFALPESSVESVLALLRSPKPLSILLHGVPGTGKTAFAKASAREAGFKVVMLRQTNAEGAEDLEHRKTALVAAQRLLAGRNCVLIVDECDPIINLNTDVISISLLQQAGDKKAWINHYLENNQLKMIWITNTTSCIDDSTKRRFSFVQEFLHLEKKQRMKAWRLQATKHSASSLTDEQLSEFAQRYKLNPGVISLALQDVLASTKGWSTDRKIQHLKKILDQHQLFILGKSQRLVGLTSRYDLKGLNTDIPLERVREALLKFFELSSTGEDIIPNLNILLMGPPGSGKTEFAKFLGEAADKELLVKRTSDLLSPFVGATEANIAQAFYEAEQSGAILFLDEADSLFINRTAAHRSWEVSQTNELLCQMENFHGVLICATNFQQNLDPAVLRRFTYKIKFGHLCPADNVIFFKRLLAPLANEELSEENEMQLAALKELTPGDFKVVQQKFYFEQPVPVQTLINALKAEAQAKAEHRGSRSLGFLD